MEFAKGQDISRTKPIEFIKRVKEKRQAQAKEQMLSEQFVAATNERNMMYSRCDLLQDRQLLEAAIYRLKAAELTQNFSIKSAKRNI